MTKIEYASDERKLRAAKLRLDHIMSELNILEDNLSFIQGDEMHDNAATSLQNEFVAMNVQLGLMRIWIVNGIETNVKLQEGR